ncbi:MAG: aspartate aminotransferase family protein [Chloroflexota bacterium]
MKVKRFRGTPYRLWNPYTPMDKFLQFLGFGATIQVQGDGLYVLNSKGRRYLNANSSTWNFALGYGREEIVQAASEQMRQLPFASLWGGSHPRAMELASRLVEISGGNYAHAYLGSNGSEVVEMALKIARQYHRQSADSSDHGRYKVISLRESYHGLGYGAVSAAAKPVYEQHYGPLMPGYVNIGPAYCYRCPYGKTAYPECGLACAQALEDLILAEGPETVAAFILEPILAEAGVITPPAEYFPAVGEICKRYGLLLIADEVTTGFGRAGRLFYSQDWNPQPDLLCLGKIISGGYLPLSALLATDRVFERFLGPDRQMLQGSTNSGHPVCAAVGLRAIDIILRENLVENAARMGARMKAGLEALMTKHAIIGDVRGEGLMAAVELVKDRQTKERFSKDAEFNILLDIMERGVLVSLDRLRLFPPLCITEELVDQMVEIIDQSLGSNKLWRGLRLAKGVLASRVTPM